MEGSQAHREQLLDRAIRLESLTFGWNVIEAAVGMVAAITSGSVALLGFGADSVLECASASVLLWRLTSESAAENRAAVLRLDRLAHKLVSILMFLLAGYVIADAVLTLWRRIHPQPSGLGIALTTVSLIVMRWLGREKNRASIALGSRALEADAFQTTACFWLSGITLSSLLINRWLGWWWVDPVGALAMTFFIAREASEAWRKED